MQEAAAKPRAQVLQETIHRLALKILECSADITSNSKHTLRLMGVEGKEGVIAALKTQRAVYKRQQAELKEQHDIAVAELSELEGGRRAQPHDFFQEDKQRLEESLYGVLNGSGAACGVAFFIAPDRALTAGHNIPDCTVGSLLQLERGDNTTVQMQVVSFDKDRDYAVLAPQDASFTSPHHLTIGAVREGGYGGEGEDCLLLTWFVNLAKEFKDYGFESSFTVIPAYLMKTAEHHLVFSAPTSDGDAGSALILTRTREVIGMHVKIIKPALERKRLKQAEEEAGPNGVKDSRLVRGFSSCALGLRLHKFNFN